MTARAKFVFEYLYRDAGNYKAWGALYLSGTSIEGVAERLSAKFEGGDLFIAEQLGIPALYAELWQYSDGPTEDDHVYHEFHDLRPITREDGVGHQVWGTVRKLLASVEAVRTWNLRLSPHWDEEY